MKASKGFTPAVLRCRVLHYNFSPKGTLEGLIVEAAGCPAQVVCPPHLADALARQVAEGVEAELRVEPAAASDKGPAAHPVYHLLELPGGNAIEGTVARLNYAKHGEANGVVLDTGDFIHLKPDGMKKAKLTVGDRVTVEGEAWPLAVGTGRVVEATRVNGVTIRPKPKG